MQNTPEEEKVTPESLITEEELEEILKADKGDDAQLKSWKTVGFTKPGDNHASVVTSIEVKYSLEDDEQEVSYVVKLNPGTGRNDLISFLFMKESSFYSKVVPELNAVLEDVGQEPLRFPHHLLSNLETDRERIYFKDVRPLGLKMHDRKEGLDEDHTSLVLKELARLHAASYLLQAKSPEDPLEAKCDFLMEEVIDLTDSSQDIVLPWMVYQLQSTADMLKEFEGYDTHIAWIESLIPELKDLLTTGLRSDRFGSVCHGDCWINNLLFRYNDEGRPDDVMLVDFQISRKASLATDLNYLLFTNVTGDVRKPNFDDFMTTYVSSYETVVEAGGHDIHFTQEELVKEFWDMSNIGAIFAMLMIPALHMDLGSSSLSDGEELMTPDPKEAVKRHLLALFDELMEMGVIP